MWKILKCTVYLHCILSPLHPHSERKGQKVKKQWLHVFTWPRITFRKTFQTPSQSGSAHCEVIFCSYCAGCADWPLHGLSMASAPISKMHTHESRSEGALRSHVLESGFLGGSRSKTPFFHISKRISKAWFEIALRSHGLKSGLQIGKGPNHVQKHLSECDSSPCEHRQYTFKNTTESMGFKKGL